MHIEIHFSYILVPFAFLKEEGNSQKKNWNSENLIHSSLKGHQPTEPQKFVTKRKRGQLYNPTVALHFKVGTKSLKRWLQGSGISGFKSNSFLPHTHVQKAALLPAFQNSHNLPNLAQCNFTPYLWYGKLTQAHACLLKWWNANRRH